MMALPATDTSSPSVPGGDPVSDALGIKEVTAKMADNQREKIAAEDKVIGGLDSIINRSIPQIEELSKKAGVEAEKLKPWDADAEAAKRRTDPIEAFGSFGSVFGILASAFTHAPMENALNASAAAMQAIKAGDKESYDRAQKGWEDNLKMTLDRHKIQHDAYQDAVSLLDVNMSAAQTKLKVLAARFGDKQVQTLLDAGMNKEVEDLLAARQRNSLALQEQMPKIVAENAKMSRLFALGYDPKQPTTEKSQEALLKFQKEQAEMKRLERVTSTNPAKVLLDRYLAENPDASATDIADFLRNSKGPSDKKLSQDDVKIAVAAKRQEEINRHNTAMEDIQEGRGDTAERRAAEAERHNKVMEGLADKKIENGGGAKDLTTDRQRAQDVKKYRRQLEDEENADGSPKNSAQDIAVKAAEYEKKLKSTAAAPSGNKVDELTGKINRVEYAESTIDKVEALLKKHKAITGLGGTISRPGEAIGNVFGSNETDRAQFKRDISELLEWAPRVLTDSNGRPLSAEAGKVTNIIAGLNVGDTTANTARAYAELRPLLKRIKEDLAKRRGGAPESSGPAAKEPPKAWESYPEAK